MFKSLLSYTTLVVTFAPHLALSQVVNAASGTLTLTNAILAPDGFSRSTVVANGIHPGPLITANKGDNFDLTVVNNLSDPTMLRSSSIHWHGFFQAGTTWADGAESVSQCPIAPNNSFEYKFSSGSNVGTFWYHSHFGTQYCDGLRGPIVVYDPDDPYLSQYDVDDETTVITLADWYHTPAPSLPVPATADATLINGQGRSVNGPATDLAVISVEAGKRYRFRLVSTSCDPNFQFSIDGHTLIIIEADGQLTQPLSVDKLQIFAGQRYSFILQANQEPDNYWVRALPSSGKNGLSSTFANGVNSAILRYVGATIADPTTSQPTSPVSLVESSLQALQNPAPPGIPGRGAADVNIQFNLSLVGGRFFINNASYVPPSVPVLLQILSGAKQASDLLPAGSVYTLPRNQVIEVTIPGFATAGPHPFHLHGHAFSVIRSAGSTVDNYSDPVRRDVVSLGGATDLVTIRFTTDNPGPWFFHCHIDFHLTAGLAVVFAEDVDDLAAANPVPPSWSDLCDIYNNLPPSATSVTLVTPATS